MGVSIRDRVVEMVRVSAAELRANPHNWREHPTGQREALRTVLADVGFAGAVLAYRDEAGALVLIDGHLRAEEVGTGDVPVLVTDLTADEADRLLAVYDPIGGMAKANAEAHKRLLEGFAGQGEALARLGEAVAAQTGIKLGQAAAADDPGAAVDKAEELAAKWGTARGQLWECGAHRLLCGDATDAGDVARVMGGGLADAVITDPPYGIDMSKGFEGFEGFGGFGPPIARRQYTDTWDQERPTAATFNLILQTAKHSLIFGGNYFADILPQSTHWVVWDKLNTMPTYGDCELVWTNLPRKSVKKITYQYNGLIGKEKERYHPTQKPLGILIELLNTYSESGGMVFDPFGGSGTTMVACEQLGRVCRMMELEPKYVAVILERMTGMGVECRLVEDRVGD